MALEQLEKPKVPRYIFGDLLGTAMSKVDLRVQYESTMLSISLMLIGMILTGIYLTIYFEFALWYKIVLVINILAGIVFMTSNLITTYQQFVNYMTALEFMKGNNDSNNDKEVNENAKNKTRRIR
jgi:hypothetical protein